MIGLRGGPLTREDDAALEARWIDPKLADEQYLRRVCAIEGAAAMGRNGAPDRAGILIAHIWPGTDCVREFGLRLDRPFIKDGRSVKYDRPPGSANQLFFPVGVTPEMLADPTLPVIITEGEFKAMALWRLAWWGGVDKPRFLPIALSGVWNWWGTIGKAYDENGCRIDVMGPISDLSRLIWDERPILTLFDSDLEDKELVRTAQFRFTKEMRSRAARVSWFHWPQPPAAKGIDDWLALVGPEPVLPLIEAAFKRTVDPPDLLPFHFADTGNAERLVMLHGADLRYCFAFKKWMRWDGARWAVDETGRALKLTKQTMIQFLRQAIEEGKDGSR
jgi:hypothetical protein